RSDASIPSTGRTRTICGTGSPGPRSAIRSTSPVSRPPPYPQASHRRARRSDCRSSAAASPISRCYRPPPRSRRRDRGPEGGLFCSRSAIVETPSARARASSASPLHYLSSEGGHVMKILASLFIVLALAGGCARRTVVYTPAASPPATVVTVPSATTTTYVVRYDTRSACEAAGGGWHSFARRCDF